MEWRKNAGRDVDIHLNILTNLLAPEQCYKLHSTAAEERPLMHGNNNTTIHPNITLPLNLREVIRLLT